MIALRSPLALFFGLCVALFLNAPIARAELLDEGSSAVEAGTPRVRVKLYSDQEQLAPSGKVRIGVHFELDPEWHIYFRNPGEAGVSTEIDLHSDSLAFKELRWPTPERFLDPSGTITTYGYEREVFFFSEAFVSPAADDMVGLRAKLDFLACKVDCIPGKVELKGQLPVGESPMPTEPSILARFDEAEAALPKRAGEEGALELEWAIEKSAILPGETLRAAIGIIRCAHPPSEGEHCGEVLAREGDLSQSFFPDRVPGMRFAVTGLRPHPNVFAGSVIDLEITAGAASVNAEAALSGILALESDRGPLAIEFSFPFKRATEDGERSTSESPLLAGTLDENHERGGGAGAITSTADANAPLSLGLLILLAFLGGVILNVMPCVLPVLSLKVFGLIRLAGDSSARRFAHAGAYTGGIFATLMALAAFVIGLRAAGTEVGWGFQLQSPIFATLLAAVLLIFALNLFGVFQIQVGAGALGAEADRRDGLTRSFLEGVLTVILATPCSAPFLGTAIGFAFTSDATMIVLIFSFIALGLAAPFVLLSIVPSATRFLPKPGEWMNKLQQFFAFLLLGTAIWLLFIVGEVAGVMGVTRALVFLLITGFSLWVFALFRGGKRALNLIGVGIALGLLVFGGMYTLRFETSLARSFKDVEEGAFSEEAVAAHLRAGRPVFVDFTAAWCITCKANERLVLSRSSVRDALRAGEFAFLIGDYTDGDETIREFLFRYGKAGVPLYLVYSPDRPEEPEILPELLTEGMVLSALERAIPNSK